MEGHAEEVQLTHEQVHHLLHAASDQCTRCKGPVRYYCVDRQCRKKGLACYDCAQQSLQYEHYQHNLSYLEEFLSEGKPTYYSGFLEEVQQFLGGVVEQKLKL